MSNAGETSRTVLVTARVPRDVVAALRARRQPATDVLVAALRAYLRCPEPPERVAAPARTVAPVAQSEV